MIAGQLEIQMMANMARLSKDMKQATGTVNSSMSKIDRAVGGTMKLLGALGVGLSINYFGKMISGAIDAQDQLAKTSDKIGATAQELTGLRHAGELTGVSMTTMDMALQRAVRRIAEAEQGTGEAVKALKELNLDAKELNDLPLDVRMGKIADSLSGVENQSDKVRIAMKLFDSEGVALVNTLGKGGDALAEMVAEGKRLNPVTEESVRQAELFNDSILRLKGSATGFGVSMLNKVLPGLSRFVESSAEFTRSESFKGFLDNIRLAGEFLAIVLGVKLVLSLQKYTLTQAAAMREGVRYQMHLASMAGISGRAAIAQTALATATGAFRGALALVGGPIGATTLLLGGLYIAYKRVAEAQDNAKKNARDWIEATGGIEAIDLTIVAAVQNLNAVNVEMEKVSHNLANPHAAGVFQALRKEQIELVEELNDLGRRRVALMETEVEETETLTTAEKEWLRVLDDLNDESSDLFKQIDKVTESVKLQSNAVDDHIRSLHDQLRLTEMTEREQTILNATMQIGEGATLNQVAAAMVLNSVMYDQSEAAKAAADAEAARADIAKAADAKRLEANRQTEEAIRRQWERTRDTLSDAFVDAAMNGSNFFDSIIESSKRAALQVAADWAFTKLLDFSGLTSLIGKGAMLPGGGGGVGGSLISAGASSGASAILGKIGGLFSGGAASTAGVAGIEAGMAAAAAAGANAGAAAGVAGMEAAMAAHGATGAASGGSFLSGVGGAAGAAGIAALAVIAGKLIHDKTSNPDGYTRSNAGFFTAPTVGVDPSKTFNVERFKSGFSPTGYAHRSSIADATKIIDQFRFVDDAIFDAVQKAGLRLNASSATFSGVGSDGVFGTNGTFAGMGGKTVDMQLQVDRYARELAQHIEGLTPDTMAKLAGASNATELISILKDVAGEIGDAAKSVNSALSVADSWRSKAAAIEAEEERAKIQSFLGDSGFKGISADTYRRAAATRDKLSDPEYRQQLWNRMPAHLRPDSPDSFAPWKEGQTGPDKQGSQNSLASELQNLTAEVAKGNQASQRTADLLTQVTRDGNSLLVENA